MNKLTDTELRGLLEAFANAETTEEQEALLMNHFIHCADVPEGLEAEAAMFKAMAAARESLSEIPDDLEGRIRRATTARRRHLWFRYISGGAAAALIAAIFIFAGMSRTVQEEPEQQLIAENDPFIEITDSTQVVEITTEVFRNLQASLSKAEIGIESTDKAITKVSETFEKYTN